MGDDESDESATLRGVSPPRRLVNSLQAELPPTVLRRLTDEPEPDPWQEHQSKAAELDGTSLLGYNHDRSGEHEHEHRASS